MKSIRTFFAAALVIAAFASIAHAADFATVSYPVAINVEGTYVPTSMTMSLTVKQYNMPLDVFSAGQLDPREATFAATMNAIRDKNYIRAESLLQPRAVEAAQVEKARSRVRQEPHSVRETVDLYDTAFNGLRGVSVVAQVLEGSRSLFIWQVSSPKGVMRRGFSVGMSDQKLAASEVNMEHPIEVLIVNNVFGATLTGPVAKSAVKKSIEYALPVEGPGNPGANHVVLQFDGHALDFSVLDEKVVASDDISRLYRAAYSALQGHNTDEYLKYFTATSREKLRKWFATLTPAALDSFLAATGERKLQYVMNADPVYIVFYTSAQPMPNGVMPYDYLLRQNDGKLVFANVSREGFLDDVLKNSALFNLNAVFGAKQQ